MCGRKHRIMPPNKKKFDLITRMMDGYTVISGVLRDEECDRIRRDIIRFLTDAHGSRAALKRFSRRHNRAGIWDGVQNHPLLWRIRRSRRVRRAFLDATFPDRSKNERFQVSIDRIGFRSSDFGQEYEEWWHWDEDPTTPGRRFQGFVCLTDDDVLAIVPLSKNMSHLYKEGGIVDDPDHVATMKHICHRIIAPKGSLVIWDSACLHTPLSKSHLPERMVVYIKYLPSRIFTIAPDDPVRSKTRCSWSGFDYASALKKYGN